MEFGDCAIADGVPEILKATRENLRLGASQIRTEIRHIIDVMGKEGGFILSPSHAVQIDTPPRNILAVYQEAGSLMDSLPTAVSHVITDTHYGPLPPDS